MKKIILLAFAALMLWMIAEAGGPPPGKVLSRGGTAKRSVLVAGDLSVTASILLPERVWMDPTRAIVNNGSQVVAPCPASGDTIIDVAVVFRPGGWPVDSDSAKRLWMVFSRYDATTHEFSYLLSSNNLDTFSTPFNAAGDSLDNPIDSTFKDAGVSDWDLAFVENDLLAVFGRSKNDFTWLNPTGGADTAYGDSIFLRTSSDGVTFGTRYRIWGVDAGTGSGSSAGAAVMSPSLVRDNLSYRLYCNVVDSTETGFPFLGPYYVTGTSYQGPFGADTVQVHVLKANGDTIPVAGAGVEGVWHMRVQRERGMYSMDLVTATSGGTTTKYWYCVSEDGKTFHTANTHHMAGSGSGFDRDEVYPGASFPAITEAGQLERILYYSGETGTGNWTAGRTKVRFEQPAIVADTLIIGGDTMISALAPGSGDDVKIDTNGTLVDVTDPIFVGFDSTRNDTVWVSSGSDSVLYAAVALDADSADHADAADSAGKAALDGTGNDIDDTYLRNDGDTAGAAAGFDFGDFVYSDSMNAGYGVFSYIYSNFDALFSRLRAVESDSILDIGVSSDTILFGTAEAYLSSITASNKLLTAGGTVNEAGDVSDTSGTNLQILVVRIDSTLLGFPIDTTAAGGTALADGYVLKWDDANSQWEPAADNSGGASDTSLVVADSSGAGTSVGYWADDTTFVLRFSATDSTILTIGQIIMGGSGLLSSDSLFVAGRMRIRDTIWFFNADSTDSAALSFADFPLGSGSGSTDSVLIDDGTTTLNPADSAYTIAETAPIYFAIVRSDGNPDTVYIGIEDGGILAAHLGDSSVTVGKIDHSDAETNWLDAVYAALGDLDSVSLARVFNHFDRTYTDTVNDSIYIVFSDSTGKMDTAYAGLVTYIDNVNDTSTFDWSQISTVTNKVQDGDIDFGTGANQVSTDDVTEGSTNKYDQALPDSGNWSTAYGWGDHSAQNYLDDDVADDVDDGDIDWGTGAGQVSLSDMPDEDVGDISVSGGSYTVDNYMHDHDSSTGSLGQGVIVGNNTDDTARLYFNYNQTGDPETDWDWRLFARAIDSSLNISNVHSTTPWMKFRPGDITIGRTGLTVEIYSLTATSGFTVNAETFTDLTGWGITEASNALTADSAALHSKFPYSEEVLHADGSVAGTGKIELDGYRGDTTNSDSAYTTKGYVDASGGTFTEGDSLATYVENDSVITFRADDGTTVIESENDTLELTGVIKIGSDASDDWATQDELDSNVINTAIYAGDIVTRGQLQQWNYRHNLDITHANALPQTTALTIEADSTDHNGDGVPDAWGADSAQRYSIVHPSILYVPEGRFGYRYHFVGTSFPFNDLSLEYPIYRVSNDGETWTRKSGVDDPLYDTSDVNEVGFTATYFSDNEIFWDANGNLWLVFRASESGGANSRLYVAEYDGSSWDASPTMIIDGDNWWGISTDADLISPSVVLDVEDTTETYRLWFVQTGVGADNDSNAVRMCTAPQPDSGWPASSSSIGNVFECDWEAGGTDSSNNRVWHIEVIPHGPEDYFALVAQGAYSDGSNSTLWAASSHDASGVTWEPGDDTVVSGNGASWSATQVYRSTGFFQNQGYDETFDLFYNGYNATDDVWRVGRTTLSFRDASRDTQYVYLNTVHSIKKSAEDSIYLTFPATGANGDTTMLFVDSAGNISPDKGDTVHVTGELPFACRIKNLEVMYMTGAEVSNNWIKGGSSGLCDSTFMTNTTDLTSATWDTASFQFTPSKRVPRGYKIGWKCETTFGADNERLRVAWVRVRVLPDEER